MTVPVPAGAGGVDREAIRARQTKAVAALLQALRCLPPGELRSGCVVSTRDAVRDAIRATVLADVTALLAALAAAEQRADTAAELVGSMCHWRFDEDKGTDPSEQHMAYHFGRWPGQSGVCPYEAMAAVLRGRPDPRVAALSSRPVQPDTERSET